jgi:hypothetical protein
MTDTLAQSLYHYGLTVEQISNSDVNELAQVPGFSPEKAAEIKENAGKLISSGQLAEMRRQMLEAERLAVQKAKTSSDSVFERLKAEVKAHQERERAGAPALEAASAAPAQKPAEADSQPAADGAASAQENTETPKE